MPTTFTTLALAPDGSFAYPEAQALYANPIAITEGAAGAPKVQKLALYTAFNTLTGTLAANTGVTLTMGGGFAFFPAANATYASTVVPIDVSIVSGSSDPDAPLIQIYNGNSFPVNYSLTWRAII